MPRMSKLFFTIVLCVGAWFGYKYIARLGPEKVSFTEQLSPTGLKVKSLLSTHDIVVFSKTYCPYCKATKSKLQELNLSSIAHVFELDYEKDGSDVHGYLKDEHTQTSVPYVFIKGKLIGGNQEFQAATRGATSRTAKSVLGLDNDSL